jgi:hypothetical protein
MNTLTRHQVKEGAIARQELGFARITDSAKEAVKLILSGLPPALRDKLAPLA